MTARTAAIALALLAALGPRPAQAALSGKRAGLTLGTGGGGWSYGGSTSSFVDALARDPLRLSLGVDGDARLGEWIRGGLRSSTLWLYAGRDGTHTSLVLTRLEAVAILRPPWPAGPFARAGLGPAGIWHSADVPGLASGSVGAGGGAVSVTAGAFVARGDVELRIEAEGSAQAWLASSGGPDWSWTVIGSVGAAWGW
jgi:hypothetical protein